MRAALLIFVLNMRRISFTHQRIGDTRICSSDCAYILPEIRSKSSPEKWVEEMLVGKESQRMEGW